MQLRGLKNLFTQAENRQECASVYGGKTHGAGVRSPLPSSAADRSVLDPPR